MKFWLFIQTGIDIILFLLIFLYLYVSKKKAKNTISMEDYDRLSVLMKSLNDLLEDSEETTESFVRRVEESKGDLDDMMKELDHKKEDMAVLLGTLNRLTDNLSKSNTTQKDEKYSQVSLLLKRGVDVKEIAKELDLSISEVTLIKNLSLSHHI